MATRSDLAQEILDTALGLAGEDGWDRVRLHKVADRLDIPLQRIHDIYPDLDAVGNALFARANAAMLAAGDAAGYTDLPASERIFLAIAAWLRVLAPHRPAVKAMLRYKAQPAHVHLQAALVVGLSRTVQWLREAARLDAVGRQSQVEEVGLSALMVATLIYWLFDRSEDQAKTRAFVQRRLARADRLMSALFR